GLPRTRRHERLVGRKRGKSNGHNSLRRYSRQRRSHAGGTAIQFRVGRGRSRSPTNDLSRWRSRLPDEGRCCRGGHARRDAAAKGHAGSGHRSESADLRLREVLGGPWGYRSGSQEQERPVHHPENLCRENRRSRQGGVTLVAQQTPPQDLEAAYTEANATPRPAITPCLTASVWSNSIDTLNLMPARCSARTVTLLVADPSSRISRGSSASASGAMSRRLAHS